MAMKGLEFLVGKEVDIFNPNDTEEVDGLMASVAAIVALSLVANDEPAIALIPAGIGAAYLGGAVHGSRAVDVGWLRQAARDRACTGCLGFGRPAWRARDGRATRCGR